MPRVYLTEKQKKEAAERDAVKKMYRLISDNLILYKSREEVTDAELGELFDVGNKSIVHLRKMEPIYVEIYKLLRILYVLGLEVRPRNQA